LNDGIAPNGFRSRQANAVLYCLSGVADFAILNKSAESGYTQAKQDSGDRQPHHELDEADTPLPVQWP
jgi:hypothetical protein